MKKLDLYKRLFSLLICLALIFSVSLSAFADDGDEGVIDPAAIEKLVGDYMAANSIDPKNFSVGYVYTATGEEWYHNPDTWYYPASMYKVPLMMMLAEKVSSGELSQDSDLGGYDVALAEEYIISYSNNDYAHMIRKYLGGDEVWREHAKSYASLEQDDYNPDYMDYCYFSPRYITQVVKTLYSEPQRFPNIIECMLVARPTHDFRLSEHMNNSYQIAQKYGSYADDMGDNWNHNTGIIYTPSPFVLTVMTRNVPNHEKLISDVAEMLTEYTLSLDEELVEYEEEQIEAAEEAAAAAEAERIAAEEKAAAEKAEAERIAAEEAAEKERIAAEKEQKKTLMLLGGCAVLALVLLVLVIVLIKKQRKRKRYEAYRRRFEQELRQRGEKF